MPKAWSDRSSRSSSAPRPSRPRPRPSGASTLVDFHEPTPEAAVSLMNTLARIRPAALPGPLPEPPTDPTALLAGPREQVRAEHLSFDQQAQVASEVLALAANPDLHPFVMEILTALRRRIDIAKLVADDIDRARVQTAPEPALDRPPPVDLDALDDGRCTPVLGFGLTDSLVGTRREIARSWSETFDYPKPAERWTTCRRSRSSSRLSVAGSSSGHPWSTTSSTGSASRPMSVTRPSTHCCNAAGRRAPSKTTASHIASWLG